MKIAAIIPCYNEEITIKQVIEDIKNYCPKCEIYVFDNNSNDNSYNIAKESGAIVKKVMYQGKGEVVRNAFSIIDANIYILIDADGECGRFGYTFFNKLFDKRRFGYDYRNS